MKILGVELKTPSFLQLFVDAVIYSIFMLIPLSLYKFGIVDGSDFKMMGIGAAAGVLAGSYGVSIREHGFRGIVVVSLFGVGLMSLVSVLEAFFGSLVV